MFNKMNIIMNEKMEAKRIIEKNEIDINKPSRTIILLIKYYYNEKHINKENIRKNIEIFMQNNYVGFNSTRWQDSLDRMVKVYANDKYRLINIKRIFVTEKEFNKILDLKDIELEKLAFVLLVYAKVYNQINEKNDNWVKSKKLDILKDAKIKLRNKKRRYKLFNELYKRGYIKFAKRIDNTSVQIQYINNISQVKIEIDNFNNFIPQYLKYKKGYCSMCGKKLSGKSPKQKYCPQCARKVWNEQVKNNMREYRKRKKNKSAL